MHMLKTVINSLYNLVTILSLLDEFSKSEVGG